MPILDLQRRGRQIGEIRIGMVVTASNGKTHPTKLDAFRFTTKSPGIAEAVASLLGGEARSTKLQNGTPSWEVITEATELPVMVPPGDNVISQWYEMWSAAGCARRCDGQTEQLTQSPCKCPSDSDKRNELAKSGSACKPTTRLNVMLPDLPDLGVWLLTSHGWNAAGELGGAAEVLAAARNSGVIVPAILRLEQREVRTVGEKPKKFTVPVLEIGASLRQMTELHSGAIADALPPAPANTLAIEAGDDTVNLWPYITETLKTKTERELLRNEWDSHFAFSTTAVPSGKADRLKRLIDTFRKADPDDEPVDAEIVDEGPVTYI